MYPAPEPKGFDQLAYLAGCLDCIELNSSFYRPPSAQAAASWVRRVAPYPDFLFTVKLWQRFTHERVEDDFARDVDVFRQGVEPLADAGKLGALLVQFPWSFQRTRENAAWMARVCEAFADWRPVVEVRHASWLEDGVRDWLERHGVGLCAIDQPLFDGSLGPEATRISGAVGYARFHGRNRANWFREDAQTWERYDYLYSQEELDPWLARIRAIAGDAGETFAVTNNHYRGQALVNALEIRAALLERPVPAPETLRRAYPRLEACTIPIGARGGMRLNADLFD